jgi:putative transposase
VKIPGHWHYLYRRVGAHGQVLDGWLSRTRDLAAAEAFFRRSINSTGCTPLHVATDKAASYPGGNPHLRAWRQAHRHRRL